ncbi:MAG: GGDEF domain-containing protein [Lachnospiraceae bacterium]|nr:GGDEF domain-containing protein [Lachnospiraceae bacterium]
MNQKTQYEKDVEYIAKIDQLLSKRVEFLAYFVALVACLAAHAMYCALFFAFGIKEMAIFNIGSVIFYTMTIILARRVKEKLNLVYCALAEIVIHATAATVFVGWQANFAMFLLMIIPIAFLMPNKNKSIPFVIMGSSVVLYVMLHLFDERFTYWRYELEDERFNLVFFAINAVIGVFVLIYVTYIYTLTNLYQESKLRVQNEQLKVMASVDPLTKLNNRRAMGEELKRIGVESDLSGMSYAVGLGDIDNFKKVNDTYGHDHGDAVLEKVARMFMEQLPEKSRIARWGGEEFLFVIPDSNVKEASQWAEKTLQAVRQYEFKKDGKSFSITMTIGVCEGKGAEAINGTITAADQLLYYGKNHGKDQVVLPK